MLYEVTEIVACHHDQAFYFVVAEDKSRQKKCVIDLLTFPCHLAWGQTQQK